MNLYFTEKFSDVSLIEFYSQLFKYEMQILQFPNKNKANLIFIFVKVFFLYKEVHLGVFQPQNIVQ